MITLEEARRILEPEFDKIPDEQLQEMIDQMLDLARMLSDLFLI